ncbi:uncharacterized protein [Chironomus tepperi]|uniref:uncharacterized protein n=1 Tax=Chironomus tepperi TaxID=113505 RepID=UPI00391FB490
MDSRVGHTDVHSSADIQLNVLHQNYLQILLNNSCTGHDKLSHLRQAFMYLDQVHPFMSLILQTVATSSNFKIIFDFYKSLDMYLDPVTEEVKRSKFLSTNEIYIPAADLLSSDLIYDVYGTLAHDLCLMAMHIVYDNCCLPYSHKDEKVMKLVTKISNYCQQHRHNDDMINLVYYYPLDMQHSELVAHYAYMLVKYSAIPFKMEQIKVNFINLSKFCENLVANDMQHRLCDIMDSQSAPEHGSTVKLCKFYILTAMLIVFGVLLTFMLTISNIESVYNCTSLTDDLRTKIYESTVDFQGVHVIFGDLFGRNSSACEHLSPLDVMKIIDSGGTANKNYKMDKTKEIGRKDKSEDAEVDPPLLKIHKGVKMLSKFYIDRNIISTVPGTTKILTFSSLTSIKLLLLSGKGGTGKSTYFRHMTSKLKQQFPLKWLSYVDLKQHIQVLQDIPANLTTLADFLALKILNLTSKIEIEIFKMKFMSNDSILLWDGVDGVGMDGMLGLKGQEGLNIEGRTDEIVLDIARMKKIDNLLNLIEIVSKLTDNKQWIATRSYLEDTVTYKLDIKAHHLVKLDKNDQINYIDKFIDVEGSKCLNSSIIYEKWWKIRKEIGEIRPDYVEILDNFDGNLQIFQIFIELNSKKSLKFENNLNLYEIYEENFERIVKNIQGSSINDVTKTLQYFALKPIFKNLIFNLIDGQYDRNFESLEIYNSTIYRNINRILNLGIVHKNEEEIFFDDKIFQDFFIAKYFFDNIWDVKDVKDVKIDENEAKYRLEFLFFMFFSVKVPHQIVAMHMLGFIETYQNQVEPEFPKIFSNLMCQNYSDLFEIIAADADLEKVNLATKFFKKDSKIVNILWKIDENRTYFHEYLKNPLNSDEIIAMGRVVDDNFSPEAAQKIKKGKNQSVFLLSILWSHRANFSAISKALNYSYDVTIVKNISNLRNFHEFLAHNDFKYEEIHEYFMTNLENLFEKNEKSKILEEFARKLLSKEDFVKLRSMKIMIPLPMNKLKIWG